MCGIAGYARPAGLLDPRVIQQMAGRVSHRGPDGTHVWTDATNGVALGHTRLKVIDLTAAADQPMVACGGGQIGEPGAGAGPAFALIYNGEIYNFAELRRELEADGVRFASTGDTAVLFELCRRDPSLSFLSRLNGMFAFALWDGQRQTLTLVRDRTGVKPLLYAEVNGGLVFGSEMAALRPALRGLSIDRHAMVQLLTLGFIGSPRTIFRQIRKLEPGRLLRWTTRGVEVVHWSPPAPPPLVHDIEEAKGMLREKVYRAVADRLVADVPVGVFLSGGIDSSVVTAAAARQVGSRLHTYSVGFPSDAPFDETRYARAVAQRWGTQHSVLPLTLDDILSAIPTVLDHLGEPFADSSALPTYLLSGLTRRHVTVALAGDGADELFGGYRRYAAARLVRQFGWLAATPFYGVLRRAIDGLPTRRETRVGSKISQLKRAIRGIDASPARRYANWMRITDDSSLGRLLDGTPIGTHVADIESYLWDHRGEPRESNDLNAHLWTEWTTSLPDDMLTKVDLMSMAHGLEVRSPFLDFRVAEFVTPLPSDWKVRGRRRKHLLIEAFRDDLPEMLYRRPKQGFEVPVGPWLRGPLYSMARVLIEENRLLFSSMLSRAGALSLLDEHRDGRADHTSTLWALFALLWWHRRHAAEIGLDAESVHLPATVAASFV